MLTDLPSSLIRLKIWRQMLCPRLSPTSFYISSNWLVFLSMVVCTTEILHPSKEREPFSLSRFWTMWEIKQIIKLEAKILPILSMQLSWKMNLVEEPNTSTKTSPELEKLIYPTPGNTGLGQQGSLTRWGKSKRTARAASRQAHS